MSIRYERKFHCNDKTASDVMLLMKLHPAHFRIAYPPRWINNVYFDTAALDTFTIHVAGSPYRSKVRLRWYGEAEGPIERPVLEIKRRHGTVGSKTQYALRAMDPQSSRDVRGALHSLDGDKDDEIRARVSAMAPSLLNRYLRQYLVTTDGIYRVTIDTDMSYRAPAGRTYGTLREYSEDTLIVIELKYDREHDLDAGRIASRMPFRLSRHSKYVSGLERLTGNRE